MRKLITVIVALLIAVTAFSQEQELSNREKKKLEKEMRKEQEAKDAEMKSKVVAVMVEYQQFVLEAEQLRDSRGNQVQVSSMINFIASDSINGVIQIGENSYVGMNGVGGITVEGPMTNYKYTLNEKNGVYSVSFNIRSSMGNYDVRMSIFRDGRADATVSSTWPGQLNYSGYVVPPIQSRVYKGTSY